jgi:hypothetical protein
VDLQRSIGAQHLLNALQLPLSQIAALVGESGYTAIGQMFEPGNLHDVTVTTPPGVVDLEDKSVFSVFMQTCF